MCCGHTRVRGCGDPDMRCIHERWTCDGSADCPNSFDEHPRTCPNSTIEKSNNCLHEFPCKKQAEEGFEEEADFIVAAGFSAEPDFVCDIHSSFDIVSMRERC